MFLYKGIHIAILFQLEITIVKNLTKKEGAYG